MPVTASGVSAANEADGEVEKEVERDYQPVNRRELHK
jgi:hypothetical protein